MFEHPDRLSSKNAFNLPIDVENSFISTHIDILRRWLEKLKKFINNYISFNGIFVSENN